MPEPPPRGHATEDEGLVVGRIVGTHGIRGEVKILPLTDFPERIGEYRQVRLRWPDGKEEEHEIVAARPHKNVMLAKLKGFTDINQVERFRDAEVWVPGERLAPLPEGHFYIHEILGMRVVTASGEEIGPVTQVIRSPANDVYVAGGLMVPATQDAVERIDPEAGVIVVRSRQFLEPEEVRP
jgi:16S rRNA processing protein RimM